MFKIPKNEKYASIAFYASCAVIVSAVIILAVCNIGSWGKYIGSFFKVLSPFVYGFVFAYLSAPIANFFEEKVFKFKNRFKLRRILSLICTLLIIAALLFLLIYAIVPSISESVDTLGSQLNSYIDNIQSFADKTVSEYSGKFFGEQHDSLSSFLKAHDIDISVKGILSSSYSFMQNALNYVLNYGGKIVSELINVLLGIFLGIYFLYNRKLISAQAKKLVAAILPRRGYLNTVSLARYTHKTFGGFIVGKIIDSIIIGLLCFIIFWIFKIPYTPLLALIIGVTNIVPNIGPIIGGVIGSFFLLIVSPGKIILFVILVLVVQQFDGNILGPKILGQSIGISAMWVLIAIVAAGALFGFFGMVIGVPAMAVIYTLIKQWTERRLQKKNMPYHTEFFAADPPVNDDSGRKFDYIEKGSEIKEITAADDIIPEKVTKEKNNIFNKIKHSQKGKKENKK